MVYNNRVEFAEDRFSFLKLHGSIGMWAQDDYGETRHGYAVPFAERAWKPADDLFFPESADQQRPQHRRAEPLLVFPHERQKILDQDSGSLSRLYVQKVWERARELVARAVEITIIGYSFAGIDRQPFLRLLSHAKQCRAIIIQDPNAEEMCLRLAARHPEWKGVLSPLPLRF